MKRNTQPRAEYPRPSYERAAWQNLNGEWEFCIDYANSGADRKFFEKKNFEEKIIVPFCPESKLSGIEHTDFMQSLWYAKNVQISKEQLRGHILLHIGACDYKTTVYVNGKNVGSHVGGYTSFSFDISCELCEGENRIIIHAEDDTRMGIQGKQPIGKQAVEYMPDGCVYSRTTGIWQTVWLEFLPKIYLEKVKINATDLNGLVLFEAKLNTFVSQAKLKIDVDLDGTRVCSEEFCLSGTTNTCAIRVNTVCLWEPGNPKLYDVRYTLYVQDEAIDCVSSYFGIRRIDIDGNKILINGKAVFQRLVLDQGFYPEGICTAPNDLALKQDIQNAMQLGFNGARLHQRVFEERFLYHADKLGYLVWGEFATWGIDITKEQATSITLPQWLEAIERDYNHPSIIGWIPYNEMGAIVGRRNPVDGQNISFAYRATKQIDSTRPVLDTSGWNHTSDTDIYDVHDYEQDTQVFAERYQKHENGEFFSSYETNIPYDGKKPYMVNEYGGMCWNADAKDKPENSWGYGNAPKSMEEFCERYVKLTDTLLKTFNITGFCYTQLYDIEQEQNGLLYYDRSKKFTDEVYQKIREVNSQKAKIEE